jgi:hypothetical protein
VFFPFTWLSFVFLFEPWNRRHAARSFLRDLEAGEAGPLCRTLLAGLLCGVLWESWNYWARTKWIYTVPGFDELKLFEMPVAGFLGFPPFAVESLVVVRFLAAVRQRAATWWRFVAWPLTAAATLAVFVAVDPVTLDSVHRPISELGTLDPEIRGRLAQACGGVPERLVRRASSAAGRQALAASAGVSVAEVEEAAARTRLVLHRGLGNERALQLAHLGIHTLDDLQRWSPDNLAAALRARRPQARDRFLERRVRVWLSRAAVAAGAARTPKS